MEYDDDKRGFGSRYEGQSRCVCGKEFPTRKTLRTHMRKCSLALWVNEEAKRKRREKKKKNPYPRKLSPENIQDILTAIGQGITQRRIAEQYGVDESIISHIKHGTGFYGRRCHVCQRPTQSEKPYCLFHLMYLDYPRQVREAIESDPSLLEDWTEEQVSEPQEIFAERVEQIIVEKILTGEKYRGIAQSVYFQTGIRVTEDMVRWIARKYNLSGRKKAL